MDVDAHTKTVTVNDLSFPVLDYGAGPAVLLLHGFPDSRHLWRHQIPALAQAGLRVIAPDLRGFGDAPKPSAVEEYTIPKVVGDVLGIMDALGIERFRLVGHDWGAWVAWVITGHHAHRVERLAALSVGLGIGTGIEQRERSWYMLFFQFEGIAEAWLQRDDWKLMREWLRGDGDQERYMRDLARPGALTAGLNWYRANRKPLMPPAAPPPFPQITCPVLALWSDGDHYLTEAHVANSYQRVTGRWRYEKISGASHWLMLDKPDEVNRLLVEFLV